MSEPVKEEEIEVVEEESVEEEIESVEEEEEETKPVKLDKDGLEIPQRYMRGSVMSPPPPSKVKKYNAERAKIRHKKRAQELIDNPPVSKGPRVPVSAGVQTVPGKDIHIFTPSVDGEISDIKIMVNVGNFQEKAILEFMMSSGNKTEIERIEIVQNTSIDMDNIIDVKIGDEFSVRAEVVVNLIISMMFREKI